MCVLEAVCWLVLAWWRSARTGDAGQRGTLGRKRSTGIFEPFVAGKDSERPAAVPAVLADRDRDVDDAVAARHLEPGGFGIDDRQPAAGLAAVVLGKDLQVGQLHPSQHAIIRVFLQQRGGLFKTIHGRIVPRILRSGSAR